MKKISYLLLMIIVSVVMISVGCKKKNNDNKGATKEQFVGTWKGTVTYTGGDSWTRQATLSVSLSDNVLLGYLTIENNPEVTRLRQITFADGILTFSFVCPTPESEDCKNWNVNGTLTLADNKLTINASGIFCANGGGEQGIVLGGLIKESSTPEEGKYFTFAQAAREWRYRVTSFGGSTCLLKFYINEDLGNGVFSGTAMNDCGWQWEQLQFRWYVSPNMWCDMMTSSLDSRILNMLNNAQVGDRYVTKIGNDSIVVEVIALNEPIVIDGKTYSCFKVLKKGVQFGGYFEGYVWGSFGIGLIKYEAILPDNLSDVHTEELVWRNFLP